MKDRSIDKKRIFVRRYRNVIILFLFVLILVSVLSVMFGSRQVSLDTIVDALFHPEVSDYAVNVVRKRVPRTVFGILCGASLGISGALMQAITRNPIADPSILGVNTGAALLVVIGITFFNITAPGHYILIAIVGSFVTAVFVYGIGSLGSSGATPVKLALAGAAASAVLSSIISAILIPRSFVSNMYRYWQVGSIGAGTYESIRILVPFVLVGTVLAVILASALNAMALGEESAVGLGVRTGLVRVVSAFAGVILCGAVTAVAGPIGFVGLLAPHLIKLLIGPDLRFVIPLSALAGSIILLAADIVGRLLMYPGELEVGIVTAFVGAPILILTAMRSKV